MTAHLHAEPQRRWSAGDTPAKLCPTCGSEILRQPGERPGRCAAKTYCSKRCSSQVGLGNRRPKPPLVSKEQVAAMIAQGLSLREIGEKIGKDKKAAERLCQRFDLHSKGKRGRSPKQREQVDRWKREARAMYAPRKPAALLPGTVESVDAFLARGGRITQCAPAYVAASEQYR